jgi:hypothetical protein
VVRISSGAPLRYRTGHSKRAVFALDAATSVGNSALLDPGEVGIPDGSAPPLPTLMKR